MEMDLVLMSLCVFVPTIFALGLLFFPKGTEEYMRWWSLLGTAVTFVISTFVFINFYQMMETNVDPDYTNTSIKRASRNTTLLERANTAAKAKTGDKPDRPDNLLARYPWVARFNIDY